MDAFKGYLLLMSFVIEDIDMTVSSLPGGPVVSALYVKPWLALLGAR